MSIRGNNFAITSGIPHVSPGLNSSIYKTFTVLYWAKHTAEQAMEEYPVQLRHADGLSAVAFVAGVASNVALANGDNQQEMNEGLPSAIPSTWTPIVFRYDGTATGTDRIRTWVGSELVTMNDNQYHDGGGNGQVRPVTAIQILGGCYNNYLISDLAVWNRALSDTEIGHLTTNRWSPLGVSAGLKGYWKFRSNETITAIHDYGLYGSNFNASGGTLVADEPNIVEQVTITTGVSQGQGTITPASLQGAVGGSGLITATPSQGWRVVEWSGTTNDSNTIVANKSTCITYNYVEFDEDRTATSASLMKSFS